MDLAALLVLSHESLCAVEEALLELDQGLLLLIALRLKLVYQFVHHGLVVHCLSKGAVAVLSKQVFQSVISKLLVCKSFLAVQLFLSALKVFLNFVKQLGAVTLVLRHISNKPLQLHFRLKLGHSLGSIQIRITMGCHSRASQDACLVELSLQESSELGFNDAKGLVFGVTLPPEGFELLHEVKDGVSVVEFVRTLLLVKRVDVRHHLQLGERLVELRHDVGVLVVHSVFAVVHTVTAHRPQERTGVEGFHLVKAVLLWPASRR